MTAVYAVGIREAELYKSQGPVGERVIAVTYAQVSRLSDDFSEVYTEMGWHVRQC